MSSKVANSLLAKFISIVVTSFALASCGSGSINSSPDASLPVAPSITTQPQSQMVTVGETATFTVAAAGTEPLHYQWSRDATNVGTDSSGYITPPTVLGDNGAVFSVVVTNTTGTINSSNATLTVSAAPVAPSITVQPQNQTVTAPNFATFSVTATGTAPLSYQWKKNGADIPGAASASYTTPATSTADNGSQFSVTVSNAVGSVPSNTATLTVSGQISCPAGPSVPQAFQNVTVSARKTDSVRIYWDAAVFGDCTIEYGENTAYGLLSPAEPLAFFHIVTLNGLAAGTSYNFRIRSKDFCENQAISDNFTFSTRTKTELDNAIKSKRGDSATGHVYYVRPKTDTPPGNNTNDGLSPEKAWETFDKAAATAKAGDIVNFLDGNYSINSPLAFNDGLDVAPIVFQSHSGTQVSVQAPVAKAIQLSGRSYIELKGFHVSGGSGEYLYFRYGSHHITLQDSTLSTCCNATGIYGDTSFVEFRNVLFDGGGYNMNQIASADDISPKNITFDGCTLQNDSAHAMIDISGNNDSGNNGVIILLKIFNSTFVNGTSDPIYTHQGFTERIHIKGNTMHDNSPETIYFDGAGTKNSCLEGNTLYNAPSLIFMRQGNWVGTSTDNILFNNKLYGATNHVLYVESDNTLLANNDVTRGSAAYDYEIAKPGCTIRDHRGDNPFVVNATASVKIQFSDKRAFTVNGTAATVYADRSEVAFSGGVATVSIP